MAKTNFSNGSFLTPTFVNKIFGTTGNTGHKHDGLNQDGSVPKVNLSGGAEVQGVLPESMCTNVEGAHDWLEKVVTEGGQTIDYSSTDNLYNAIVQIIQTESPAPDLSDYVKKDGSVTYTGEQQFTTIETTGESIFGYPTRTSRFGTNTAGDAGSQVSNAQVTYIQHDGGYGTLYFVSGRLRCSAAVIGLSEIGWPSDGYLVHDVYFISQVASGETSSIRRFHHAFQGGDGVSRGLQDPYVPNAGNTALVPDSNQTEAPSGQAYFQHNGTTTCAAYGGLGGVHNYLQYSGLIWRFENKVDNPLTEPFE